MKTSNKNLKHRDNHIEITTPEELEKMLIGFGYSYIPAKHYAQPGSIVWREGNFEVSVAIPKLPQRKMEARIFRADSPEWRGGSGHHVNLKLPFTKYRLQHEIALALKHCGYEKDG